MSFIKELFKRLDKRISRTIIGFLIAVIIIIIVVFIIGKMTNKRISYSSLEKKINEAAIEYYDNNKSLLPSIEGEEIKIDTTTLIENKHLKELTKYIKNEVCKGEVYASYTNGNVLYTPYLNCDNYKTKTLYSEIINNEDIVTEGNGLYNYDGTLIYRGEEVNNYIEYAGQLWHILRINEDKTIRIFQVESMGRFAWDNRYNVNVSKYYGYNDFEISRLKEKFPLIYSGYYGKIFQEGQLKYLTWQNLCLDKKTDSSFDVSGNIECNSPSKEKYQFGLPDISEYFIASIDSSCNSFNNLACTNYNYMNSYGGYWSMNAKSDNSYESYYISGGAYSAKVNELQSLKLILTLSKHTMYESGDGTADNPYKIKY